MKGFEAMTMTYISLAVLLLLSTFAITPLYASVRDATKNNARLTAMEIAGSINAMQASPSENLDFTFTLPSKCTIEITDKFVKVGIDDSSYIFDFLITNNTILPQSIDCKQEIMTMQKKGNIIETR